jgi:hypothetical protein
MSESSSPAPTSSGRSRPVAGSAPGAGAGTRLGTANRVGRVAIGERLAGFIYGTIVVLSVVVVGARAFPHHAGRIAAMVVVTTVVFWLAHVYAHALAHSVAHDEHLSSAVVRHIARREASVVEAAVPPLAALLVGAVGVMSTSSAVWTALGLGLVVLGAQGIVFARVERLGPATTIGVVSANVGLGVVLVALKVLVAH